MEEHIAGFSFDERSGHFRNANSEARNVKLGSQQNALSGAYAALLAFMIVYFLRPEDWVPGVSSFPFAKITGILAVIALLFSLPQIHQRFPREIFYFVLLIGQLFLASALSPIWRGGAIAITGSLFKAFVVILVIVLAVNSLRRLRWLIFTQAACAAMMTAASLWQSRSVLGRLEGVLGGNYGDPNDLALTLVISLPLCIALFFLARSPIEKMVWAAAIIEMTFAIFLTGSRGGFLAFLVAAAVAMWEFGIRGRRFHLMGIAAVLGVAMLMSVGGTVIQRFGDTFGSSRGNDAAYASSLERQQLFWRSLEVTRGHPLLGIGPGNFVQVSGNWHVAHNAFTQLSAEGGIPALILYILVLWSGLANVRAAKRLAKKDREVTLIAKAFVASLAGYIVGSAFLSVTYAFFPYFLVAYTAALLLIVKASGPRLPDGAPPPSPSLQPVNCFRPDVFNPASQSFESH